MGTVKAPLPYILSTPKIMFYNMFLRKKNKKNEIFPRKTAFFLQKTCTIQEKVVTL
jgi:hypothetical protein